jgi:hypothetical protein
MLTADALATRLSLEVRRSDEILREQSDRLEYRDFIVAAATVDQAIDELTEFTAQLRRADRTGRDRLHDLPGIT